MYAFPNFINISVILISFLFLFPGADTTINFRCGSLLMILPTFLNCVAFATELPPNFVTLTFIFSNPPGSYIAFLIIITQIKQLTSLRGEDRSVIKKG